MHFSKTSPLKSGKSSENPVEKIASNPVTSVAVMVFLVLKVGHFFFDLESFLGSLTRQKKRTKIT